MLDIYITLSTELNPHYQKNQLKKIQLSKKMLIFAISFSNGRQHRGERLSFDPSENLQNSKYAGEKSESCSSCSSIYTAFSFLESAYVNTCRCELIFILTHTGIAEPSD